MMAVVRRGGARSEVTTWEGMVGGSRSGKPVRWLMVTALRVDLAVFFFQAEDGIRDVAVTGVQTCALPIFARADFELLALAVSAINGCGTCVASHERQLRQHGLEREAVQSAVRIAATVHAVARVLESVSGEKPLGASQAA